MPRKIHKYKYKQNFARVFQGPGRKFSISRHFSGISGVV